MCCDFWKSRWNFSRLSLRYDPSTHVLRIFYAHRTFQERFTHVSRRKTRPFSIKHCRKRSKPKIFMGPFPGGVVYTIESLYAYVWFALRAYDTLPCERVFKAKSLPNPAEKAINQSKNACFAHKNSALFEKNALAKRLNYTHRCCRKPLKRWKTIQTLNTETWIIEKKQWMPTSP